MVARLPNKTQPGGAIVYLRGQVAASVIVLSGKAGMPAAPIVLTAWPGSTFTIQASPAQLDQAAIGDSRWWPLAPDPNNRFQRRGVELKDCEHIVIDGVDRQSFMIRGIPGHGVYAENSDFVWVNGLLIEWLSNSAVYLHFEATTKSTPNLGAYVTCCRIRYTNLGAFFDLDPTTLDYHTETISIVNYTGFLVAGCHLSNSMQEGIDVKQGSKLGTIAHNLVEYTRSAGIYVNEASYVMVRNNTVRYVGWHQVIQPPGSVPVTWIAAQWLALQAARLGPQDPVNPPEQRGGSSGITVGNGDLNCMIPPRPAS